MWEFNKTAALVAIADMIASVVGTELSFLPLSDGTPSAVRSVIISHLNGIEVPLPFVVVTFESSKDDKGFLIDSGVILVEDPSDPPNMIYAPYFDKNLNYLVRITCEGEESHDILSRLRKGLLLERNKAPLRTSIFSTIDLIHEIRTSRVLNDTAYREINTFTMSLNTTDRLIDTDKGNGGVWDTIVDGEGTLKDNEDDTSPLITNITVGPVTP